MADMAMSAGETLREVARAVIDETLDSMLNEEPLFVGVSHRLNMRVTEADVVFALGWLSGLADACDRGSTRRIA